MFLLVTKMISEPLNTYASSEEETRKEEEEEEEEEESIGEGQC